MNPLPLSWAGSSWTIGNYYVPVVQAYLIHSIAYLSNDFSFVNAALSGNNVWSNLVRLTRDILANDPKVVILDHANGTLNDFTVEAFIRRVWAHNPTTKIILIEAPSWGTLDYHNNAIVDTPLNVDTMAMVNAVAAHYGVPIVPVWTWAKDVVPDTYDLDQIFPDGVHPNFAASYNYIAGEIETFLAQGFSRTSVALPDRLYECADYENESTILLGTDYTSKTGTWAEDAGVVSSSEVGATITYTATCQSFGCYRGDAGSNLTLVEASIDGGAFESTTFYQNGVEIAGARGAHTIILRVASGTVRVDEFWAV